MAEDTNLCARRKALGLSQEQLAALLNLSQGTVSRNETAEHPDRRYEFALDALALRQQQGENLAATAEMEAARTRQNAA